MIKTKVTSSSGSVVVAKDKSTKSHHVNNSIYNGNFDPNEYSSDEERNSAKEIKDTEESQMDFIIGSKTDFESLVVSI